MRLLKNEDFEKKEKLKNTSKNRRNLSHKKGNFLMYKNKFKLKKTTKVLYSLVFLFYFLLIFILVGAVDYRDDSIYDKYKELDNETENIIKAEMKKLTISKNVYVHFFLLHEEVGDLFYEENLCDYKKYVAVIYNPNVRTFSLKSNIGYLNSVAKRDVKDLKEDIPEYFNEVDTSIKESVYPVDYYTITKDIFGEKIGLLSIILFDCLIIFIILNILIE